MQRYVASGARRALRLSGFAAAAVLALPAWATNGYFPHGYGLKSMGMAGASLAMPEDSLGGATNPAAMVWAGERVDLGLNVFSPKRKAERFGAGVATLNGEVESDKTVFYVPEAGFNRLLNPNLSLGLTVYGNGGINTTYPQGSFQCPTGPTTVAPANMLCGSGTLGVDLMQLVVAPTIAWKPAPDHSIGAALLLGYQRFKAQGLQAFEALSGSPGFVTNNGYDSSTGVGVRVGWLGRLLPTLRVGAAYTPKMNMGRFDKYKGLFAGAGDFDIPSHFGVGVAFQPVPVVTVALDAMRIKYSDVPAVHNPSSNQAPLGSANGPGFGWQDIDIVKLGVAWQATPALTLRAGYNRGDNPIGSADVSFNIIAPGVMTDHYTAGFTFVPAPKHEITGALLVAPRKSVTGASFFNALIGPGAGGSETISMKQTSFGLAWGMKF